MMPILTIITTVMTVVVGQGVDELAKIRNDGIVIISMVL